MSAHRDPDTVSDYAKNAKMRGLRVILAGAGLAAALPGVVAAHTDLPVIGVPLTSRLTFGTAAGLGGREVLDVLRDHGSSRAASSGKISRLPHAGLWLRFTHLVRPVAI